eukprot:11320851-Karenia_brevis.AAC.1
MRSQFHASPVVFDIFDIERANKQTQCGHSPQCCTDGSQTLLTVEPNALNKFVYVECEDMPKLGDLFAESSPRVTDVTLWLPAKSVFAVLKNTDYPLLESAAAGTLGLFAVPSRRLQGRPIFYRKLGFTKTRAAFLAMLLTFPPFQVQCSVPTVIIEAVHALQTQPWSILASFTKQIRGQ